MALFKRGKVWWTDFSVHGQRYRQSLKTRDWRKAEALEKELIAQASGGNLAPQAQSFARLRFAEAADKYLEGRSLELTESSRKKERQLLVFPRKYFQTQSIAAISTESLLGYREWRAKTGVGAAILNMEMGTLRRILKRAKRWHLVGADLKPLRERHTLGKALMPEDKARLLQIARQKPEWQAARCAMILALNTTMRGCELRGLRWRDIDFEARTLTIERSKTEAGERMIPLNTDALAALWELRQRASIVGEILPVHYVFPACENCHFDPTRPQKSWRTVWRKLTRAAGLPGLRFHDLRHHAITELAESQANNEIIMSIAGHVSPRMLHHYSHIRLEAKRRALDGLAEKMDETVEALESRYGTKHVTMPVSEGGQNVQVIDQYGRHVGTRTPDLYRVKVAL